MIYFCCKHIIQSISQKHEPLHYSSKYFRNRSIRPNPFKTPDRPVVINGTQSIFAVLHIHQKRQNKKLFIHSIHHNQG